jgi:hypothetical protein
MIDEFKKALGSPEPYYMCVGYGMLVLQKHLSIFDRQIYCVSLENLHGIYCYSLLERCKGILHISTWANTASTLGMHDSPIWHKLIDEFCMVGCRVAQIELPLEAIDSGMAQRRAIYKDEIVSNPVILYRDMLDSRLSEHSIRKAARFFTRSIVSGRDDLRL